MSICLKDITIENYFDVLNLEVHPNQRNFIASNSISLAEAYVYDKNGEENIYSHYSMLGLGMKELEFRDDFPKQFIHAGPCCEGFDKNKYQQKARKI